MIRKQGITRRQLTAGISREYPVRFTSPDAEVGVPGKGKAWLCLAPRGDGRASGRCKINNNMCRGIVAKGKHGSCTKGCNGT